MSSRVDGLPDFERDLPTTAEDTKYLRWLRENPPRLTWDEYVRAVDELNEQWPPNRDVPKWDEPFEL